MCGGYSLWLDSSSLSQDFPLQSLLVCLSTTSTIVLVTDGSEGSGGQIILLLIATVAKGYGGRENR